MNKQECTREVARRERAGHSQGPAEAKGSDSGAAISLFHVQGEAGQNRARGRRAVHLLCSAPAFAQHCVSAVQNRAARGGAWHRGKEQQNRRKQGRREASRQGWGEHGRAQVDVPQQDRARANK